MNAQLEGNGSLLRALAVGLGALLLLSPATVRGADLYEPDDTPAQATLVAADGVLQEHTYDPAGDVDWIKFRGLGGERYFISTAGDTDAYLELYDADGSTLLAQDDDGGPAGNASIVWNCWYTGTYFVKSSHFLTTGTGDYRLGVAQSGTIAGAIFFAGTGAAPVGVSVVVHDAATGEQVGNAWASESSGWAYDVGGLAPGAYLAHFEPVSGAFLEEWWDDRPDALTATSIAVSAGQTTWDVNPVLGPGGVVAGTIGFFGSGSLPGSVWVVLHPVLSTGGQREVSAGPAGGWAYRFEGLPKGSYRLEFIPESSGCTDYGGEWWQDAADAGSATPLIVLPGFDVTGIDPILDTRYGTIAGTVAFAAGGTLPSWVSADVVDGATGDFVRSADASESGGWAFEVCRLPPGSYKVAFYPGGGTYGSEWWEDGPTFDAAREVALTAGVTAGGVNPLLDPLAAISGTLRFLPGGVLPSEVQVSARESESGDLAASAWVYADEGWSYSLERLRPGSYRVSFEPYDGEYLAEWWDNAADSGAADSLALAAGQQVWEVNPFLSTAAGDPVLFLDTFRDGSAVGDAEWQPVGGSWTVNAKKQYACLSLSGANLSLVKRFVPAAFPLLAGRVESKVTLTERAARLPNARLLFGYQGAGRYRYLELAPGGLAIGQVGSFGGMAGGVKARASLPWVVPGATLAIRVDLHADGRVRVYRRGTLALACKFPAAVAGGVGAGALRAGAVFDDFRVSDPGALR